MPDDASAALQKITSLHLRPLASQGRPINPAVQAQTEALTGADLSRMRIHTSPAAQRAAHHVGAKAFTVGRDIYLGSPADSLDPEVLAHEVRHIAQQDR